MAKRISTSLKNAISLMNETQKESLIFALCKQFDQVNDYIEFHHTDNYDLYVQTRILLFAQFEKKWARLDLLNGFQKNLKLAFELISKCKRKTQSPRIEIALLKDLLTHFFEHYTQFFNLSPQIIDTKIAETIAKLVLLVKKYRPENQWESYRQPINSFIQTIKQACPDLRIVQLLAENFDA